MYFYFYYCTWKVEEKVKWKDNKLNSLLHLTKLYLSAFIYGPCILNANQAKFWFYFVVIVYLFS